MIYFLSPFWSLGPLYIVIGHLIVSAVAILAQLVAGYVIRRQYECEFAEALKRAYFPAISHGIIQVLYMGSCYGTFELLLRESGTLEKIIGVIGLIYILAVPVYTVILIAKVIKPVRYLIYERFFKKRIPLRWFYPRGYYRAVYTEKEKVDEAEQKYAELDGGNADDGQESIEKDIIDEESVKGSDGFAGQLSPKEAAMDVDATSTKSAPKKKAPTDPNALTADMITENILLRGAFCTISLYMANPRRYFAIYANVMCILVCLLVHVVPQELRCSNRWLALSIVFFVTAFMLFAFRPHRAIAASFWSGICYILLGVLTILETLGVLSPSTDIQTLKVVIIIILIVLVVVRAIYSLYMWYVEDQELKRLEVPSQAAREDIVDEKMPVQEDAPPTGTDSLNGLVLQSIDTLSSAAPPSTHAPSEKLSNPITENSSGSGKPTTVGFFDATNTANHASRTNSQTSVAAEEDDSAEVVYDAVESHRPSERASVATEDFDKADEEDDEDFAAAAAVAWDDAIGHFGDDIDQAAAEVIVPEVVSPDSDGVFGRDFSDSGDQPSSHVSYSSAEAEDEGPRNVDEGNDGEAEYY
eukprot:GDKJ01000363.1.p1 GENE.GDKJ01000363.1~~GDKJ01000363.1.p1  ORF type:complete len:608 (+),score=88.76 GDKJ01000363.1:71-1825(+)